MSEELRHLAQGIIDTEGRGRVYPAHAIRALEDEIERRGLWWQYTDALMLVIFGSDVIYDWANKDFWRLIRATPEQRARAFLEAVK